MDVHLAGAVAIHTPSLHDVGPDHAAGAELGDFHEVIGADAEGELDATGHFLGVKTQFGKTGDVLVADSHGEGEFLHEAAAGVVEVVGLDIDDLDLREVGDCLDGLCQEAESFLLAEVALHGEAVQRAEVERGADLFRGNALLLDHGQEALQGFGAVLGAALAEVDLHGGDGDALEQGFHLLDGKCLLVCQDEAERLDALVQDVERLFVRLFKPLAEANVLAGEPVVVVLDTADKGELAGHLAERLDVTEVLGAVVRAHRETFVGLPYEFLLVVGPLQVLDNYRIPLFCGNRRKLSKQFFCHFYTF